MNIHLQKGKEAISQKLWAEAEEQFTLALVDPAVRMIAENRLADLRNRRVYGCAQSPLYHRENCPAKHGALSPIRRYDYWRDAEADERIPCPQCNPQRYFQDLIPDE